MIKYNMDLASKKELKGLLEKYGVRPQKRLGQHFLVEKRVLRKILDAAKLTPDDTVLEIGPGPGALTVELAERAKRVIAVEKDEKMVVVLQETLGVYRSVEIVQGDIFKTNLKSLIFNLKSYKVVTNLPYYIVSPVIRMFLESKNPPSEMVLMVQKEVAQRICAKPPRMNLLAVSVRFYAEPKIISYVSKKSFWPQPNVDGAILRIAPQINADRKRINADLFFEIVRAGFSHPRKQLINNLAGGLKIDRGRAKSWLLENNVHPEQRAETLTVANWISLAKTFDR